MKDRTQHLILEMSGMQTLRELVYLCVRVRVHVHVCVNLTSFIANLVDKCETFFDVISTAVTDIDTSGIRELEELFKILKRLYIQVSNQNWPNFMIMWKKNKFHIHE